MKKRIHFKRLFFFIIQFLFLTGIFASISSLLYLININYIYLILSLFYFINTIFVFFIGLQKRNYEAKLGWLYIITLFPVIGHALFFGFGWISKNKLELKIQNDSKYKLNTYINLGLINKENCSNELINSLSLIHQTTVKSSEYEFFKEGYRFYDKLIEDIKNAKESIYLVTYILKKSEISKEFMHILKEKAKQGVEIKWLVDYFGAYRSQRKLLRKLKKDGIEIQYIGKIIYPFINASSFNRNHQKFIIIDSEMVFSGGNNISDEYASLSKKYGHWIDLNYKITGEYINTYILHFARFWKFITRKEIEIKRKLLKLENNELYTTHSILVVDSPSYSHSSSEYTWLKLISNAKKSIKISTPYFSVSEAIYKQIILALKSGVDITVFIPGLPDKKLVYQISIWQLRKLMKYGLKVRVYNEHFLHSKLGVVDHQLGWVGTNNMDSRSMYSQYETMDVITGSAVNSIIEIFQLYNSKSTDIQDNYNLMKKYNSFENFFFSWMKLLI
ncbi:phospholipase D-like domain-containing protein [Mycoplasmopsis felis]|uniref:phospholipase D-like domain-containing protein n=1 Tax=Mycoplasmopsis felis TaxID=33923 RepID=UPI00300D711F